MSQDLIALSGQNILNSLCTAFALNCGLNQEDIPQLITLVEKRKKAVGHQIKAFQDATELAATEQDKTRQRVQALNLAADLQNLELCAAFLDAFQNDTLPKFLEEHIPHMQ